MRYSMALTRCLPPAFSVGNSGSKICHSASLRSLGYGLRRIAITGCIMQRGYHKGMQLVAPHLLEQPLISREARMLTFCLSILRRIILHYFELLTYYHALCCTKNQL